MLPARQIPQSVDKPLCGPPSTENNHSFARMTIRTRRFAARFFADVFGTSGLALNDTTRRDDVPDWDSLANIRLLMAVEDEFGIKFSARHIAEIQDLPELVVAITTHTSAVHG